MEKKNLHLQSHAKPIKTFPEFPDYQFEQVNLGTTSSGYGAMLNSIIDKEGPAMYITGYANKKTDPNTYYSRFVQNSMGDAVKRFEQDESQNFFVVPDENGYVDPTKAYRIHRKKPVTNVSLEQSVMLPDVDVIGSKSEIGNGTLIAQNRKIGGLLNYISKYHDK